MDEEPFHCFDTRFLHHQCIFVAPLLYIQYRFSSRERDDDNDDNLLTLKALPHSEGCVSNDYQMHQLIATALALKAN